MIDVHRATLRAMQSQALFWAREARAMRDMLHYAIPATMPFYRARAIEAQHYAAMYSAAIVSNL